MTWGWVHLGQEPYSPAPGQARPSGASYLLSRRREPEDAMGEWLPVFVFQEWSPLYSAPLVQSPQEQDSKLQEANNVYKDTFLQDH